MYQNSDMDWDHMDLKALLERTTCTINNDNL